MKILSMNGSTHSSNSEININRIHIKRESNELANIFLNSHKAYEYTIILFTYERKIKLI
jgi:hypothetical protein